MGGKTNTLKHKNIWVESMSQREKCKSCKYRRKKKRFKNSKWNGRSTIVRALYCLNYFL